MTAEDAFRDSTPLAALDALDGPDRVAFEGHLPGCGDCSRELRRDRAVALSLPLALAPVAPSPALRQRVLAAIWAEGPHAVPTPRKSPTRAIWWRTALTALPAAAALILGFALVRAREERDQARRTTEANQRTTAALETELQRARDVLARAPSMSEGSTAVRGDVGRAEAASREAQGHLAALERRFAEELEKARQALAARELELSRERDALLQSERRSGAETEAARQNALNLTTQLLTLQADLADVRERLAKETAFRELVAHPDSRVTPLTGIAAGSGARARIVWNPSRRAAVLLASGLPRAPEGKTYEVWVIAKGAPVPAGLFQGDAGGRVHFTLPTLEETARAKTFAVTIEPSGGRPAPSGPMVLAGTVS